MEHTQANISFPKLLVPLISIIAAEIVVFLVTHKTPNMANSPMTQDHSTLILAQVLFRHGERTPMRTIGSYPKDPYINYTYEPYGPGELTDKGKRTVFELGRYLRKYYDNFLGNYSRNIVYAKSSPYSRCRASLLLVLAGLFPPPKSLILEDDLKWQPIPYDYTESRDYVFLQYMFCPRYYNLIEEYSKRAFENEEIPNIKELARKLEAHTGLKLDNYRKIFYLYSHLLMQKEFGLELPEWTKEFMPKPLEIFETLDYNMSTKTDELKRLSGGFILNDIVQAMESKRSNVDFENRKIHLYSGHEFTVSNLLGTLGFKVGKKVPYGSFISFEMHKIGKEYALKLFLYEAITEQPKILKLEDCDEICPLAKFLSLYKKYLATPGMCK